jgi:hypothetical protein
MLSIWGPVLRSGPPQLIETGLGSAWAGLFTGVGGRWTQQRVGPIRYLVSDLVGASAARPMQGVGPIRSLVIYLAGSGPVINLAGTSAARPLQDIGGKAFAGHRPKGLYRASAEKPLQGIGREAFAGHRRRGRCRAS